MLWHDDFFTLPNGETRSLCSIGKTKDYLIIQHPYFHFGSLHNAFLWKNERLIDSEYSTPIYLNQFEVDLENRVFEFHDFQSKMEINWHLKEDETLWFETGFWSIIIGGTLSMGIGLNSLRDTLTIHPESKFAICLSNEDSMVIITSGQNKNGTILLSIYASQEVLPFAEVVEPFRKTIRSYRSATLIRDEMLREEDLRRFWFAKRPIKLDPVAYVIDREHGDYRILPILKNMFGRSRDPVIGKIDYLTGITSGGFIESEYNSDILWELYADIWDLGSLSIVEFNFRFWE